jgi:hypothetical protein
MVLLKFLHIFALMLGSATAIGNLVITYHLSQVPADAPKMAPLRPIFGMVGLVGILLIWLSGLWLYWAGWSAASLGAVFWLKMAAATILLGAVLVLTTFGMISSWRGTPPPVFVQKAGPYTFLLLLITVASAIWVFG